MRSEVVDVDPRGHEPPPQGSCLRPFPGGTLGPWPSCPSSWGQITCVRAPHAGAFSDVIGTQRALEHFLGWRFDY